jgi:hypothetical protein
MPVSTRRADLVERAHADQLFGIILRRRQGGLAGALGGDGVGDGLDQRPGLGGERCVLGEGWRRGEQQQA